MALISEIRNHRRGSPRVDVYLDGDYWRAFPRQVLEQLPIRVGEEIEPWTLVSDADSLERSYARGRVLRLLAYRERGSAELMNRLIDDGVDTEIARATVADYCESGLIDDVRFAEVLARSLIGRGQAPARIIREITRKGVSGDVAESAVYAALGGTDADEHLGQIARRLHKRDDSVERLAARLARRGFSSAQALRAARALVDESDITRES